MARSDLLHELVAHMEWADALLWNTALARDGATSDERLGFLLHHIHIVQHAYLLLWKGETLDNLPEASSFADADTLMKWALDGYREIETFLDEADDAQLDSVVSIPWAGELVAGLGRPIDEASVAQSAVQLAVHSAHHRGQCVTRLAQLGGTSPLNDFIIWVWSGKPEARWGGAES